MVNYDRKYYENLFRKYDDIVTVKILQEMLGGVSESYIRPLLQRKIINNFKIEGKGFLIPKEYIIDFVVSITYQKYKYKLKNQI